MNRPWGSWGARWFRVLLVGMSTALSQVLPELIPNPALALLLNFRGCQALSEFCQELF